MKNNLVKGSERDDRKMNRKREKGSEREEERMVHRCGQSFTLVNHGLNSRNEKESGLTE